MTCQQMRNLLNQSSVTINGTIYHLVEEENQLDHDNSPMANISDSCHEIPMGSDEWAESIQMYMTVNFTRVIVGETDLVQDPTYYNTYCIAINCIFASLIPFVALTFFNISIVMELRTKNREVGWYLYCICETKEFFEVQQHKGGECAIHINDMRFIDYSPTF